LETQRGHVVVACAFQMRCRTGYFSDESGARTVRARKAWSWWARTVFELHDGMTVTALRAFVRNQAVSQLGFKITSYFLFQADCPP